MSNDIPDTIVTMILNKLISKVCKDEIIKEIYSNLNNHCNDFIFNSLSPYLKTSFLFHENGLDMKTKNKNTIFYSSILPKKINTWISFKEPNSSLIDRYANNKNKLAKKVETKNGIKKLATIDDKIVIEKIELEKEKNSKTKKGKIKIKLKDIWKKGNNEILDKNNIKKYLFDKNIFNIKEDNTIVGHKKKNKDKDIVLEIPGTFIPYEKNEKINIILNNNEENDLLRKEMELKKSEKGKVLNKDKINSNKQNKVFKYNYNFNYDKITFDSDGNIIKLCIPNVDSFKKEFIPSYPKIKEETDESTLNKKSTYNQKNIILINKKKLKAINSKLKISETNTDKNTNIKLNTKVKLNANLDFHNKDKDKNKIKIEYNPENKADILFVKSSKEELIYPQNNYGGPNFEKISPEIGVIISDNNKDEYNKESQKSKKKIGGFEYIKKYNRPSMKEINNLLSFQNPKINSEQISSFFNYDYSKNIDNKNEINEKNNSELNKFNTENNYIGYKGEFQENINPLFQGAVHIKEEPQNFQKNSSGKSRLLNFKIKNKKSMSNENIFVPKKIKTKMKKNISYQINPLYNKRNIFLNINSISNNNYLSSVNNILLSENIKIPNLKSIFNDENIEENNMKNNLFYNSIDSETSHRNKSNNNIIAPLKNLKYRKNLLPVITEINNKDKNLIKQKFINKFNFDIINNKNWGNNGIDNENINNKNSYKEQYLKQRKKMFKSPNKAKITLNQEIKMAKFNQRNKSNIFKDFNSINLNNEY